MRSWIRFANSPLVTGDLHVRFYIGAPILTPTGKVLGALCAMDYRPRDLNKKQIEALLALSSQVSAQLVRLDCAFRPLADGTLVLRDSVSDSGMGIDQDRQFSLFERFMRKRLSLTLNESMSQNVASTD